MEKEKKNTTCKGLRVIGLEKSFYSLPCGIKSRKDVHAVRRIYFEVPDKQLFCILGHNGAGKSTLFNMLSGILNPTGG